MLRGIIRRLLVLVVTLLGVYTVVFLLAHAIPGGPWDAKTDQTLNPTTIANLRHEYALDRSLVSQYFDYLGRLFHGDLGISYRTVGESVTSIIARGAPVSAAIGASAMVLAVLIGLPLGAVAAQSRRWWVRGPIDALATVALSTPTYVTVSVLIVVLGVQLGLVPVAGWEGVFSVSAIVPVVALALPPAGAVARYFAENLRAERAQGYVAAARIRGLPEYKILLVHTARNAFLPVITVLGVYASLTLVGSFFVETIAGVPGLGRYLVLSIEARDYPVIVGVTLFVAAVVVVINMLVDISYKLFDPRVRFG